MAIRNLEVQKKNEGYIILEQAGSNYHQDHPVHESPTREDAAQWLAQQGAVADQAERALNDAASADRAFVEIAGNYSEAESFPKR